MTQKQTNIGGGVDKVGVTALFGILWSAGISASPAAWPSGMGSATVRDSWFESPRIRSVLSDLWLPKGVAFSCVTPLLPQQDFNQYKREKSKLKLIYYERKAANHCVTDQRSVLLCLNLFSLSVCIISMLSKTWHTIFISWNLIWRSGAGCRASLDKSGFWSVVQDIRAMHLDTPGSSVAAFALLWLCKCNFKLFFGLVLWVCNLPPPHPLSDGLLQHLI